MLGGRVRGMIIICQDQIQHRLLRFQNISRREVRIIDQKVIVLRDFMFLVFVTPCVFPTVFSWEETMPLKEIESQEKTTVSYWITQSHNKTAATSKEFGSPYLHPHKKKKAEQTENQWLFLDPLENWGNRANHHLKSGETEEDRGSQLTESRSRHWSQQLVGTVKGFDELLEAECELAWILKILELRS